MKQKKIGKLLEGGPKKNPQWIQGHNTVVVVVIYITVIMVTTFPFPFFSSVPTTYICLILLFCVCVTVFFSLVNAHVNQPFNVNDDDVVDRPKKKYRHPVYYYIFCLFFIRGCEIDNNNKITF